MPILPSYSCILPNLTCKVPLEMSKETMVVEGGNSETLEPKEEKPGC